VAGFIILSFSLKASRPPHRCRLGLGGGLKMIAFAVHSLRGNNNNRSWIGSSSALAKRARAMLEQFLEQMNGGEAKYREEKGTD
jgi:hypothetical protein